MIAHGFNRRRALLAPLLALPVAILSLVGGLAMHRWCLTAVAHEATRQATIKTALDDHSGARVPACAAEADYAQGLPPAISLDRFVQSLQDSANAYGATLVSVSGEPRPATTRTLATLSVSIWLRGAYPAIKSTLAEGLSRFPTAALQQMHFKRTGMAQPGVEDANLQVVFVLRPNMTIAAECRVAPLDRAAAE